MSKKKTKKEVVDWNNLTVDEIIQKIDWEGLSTNTDINTLIVYQELINVLADRIAVRRVEVERFELISAIMEGK